MHHTSAVMFHAGYRWCIVMSCATCWCCVMCTVLQCPSAGPTAVKFSLNSRRNHTGHWIGQVSLEHQGDTDPWQVDLDHTTSKCGNSESVLVEATITGPGSSNTTASSGTISTPAALENSGYVLVPGLGYYKFHTQRQTWYKAMQTCAREGTHMLILNSEQEFAAIKEMWEKDAKSSTEVHIGINDFDNEGTFVTLFDELVNSTGYVKWGTGEPDRDTKINCGYLRKTGEMFDSYCSNAFYYLCEKGI